MICPVCKKKDAVIPIQYGNPTEETMFRAQQGKLRLGGCDISDGNSKWYCKRDEVEF